MGPVLGGAAQLLRRVGAVVALDRVHGQAQPARAAEPTFEFAPGGGKTNQSATRGLDEYGPYDAESFTPKNPAIAVVAPAAFKGTAEMFIRSFLNGVPRSSFAKGFTRRYHLGSCEVAFEAFGSSPDDVAAYRNACLSALQKPRKPDLAFVITSEKQEALRGNDSSYLVCKSVFMGQGVPVQNIQIETVRGDGLACPLDSIALASYAKLGDGDRRFADAGSPARRMNVLTSRPCTRASVSIRGSCLVAASP